MKLPGKKIWEAEELLFIGFISGILIVINVWADTNPVFNQAINSAALSVDIVDSGGSSVANPSVDFDTLNYNFSTQDSNGFFAPSAERIRAYNPTSTATWTVNLSGSSATDTWTSGSDHYDFNDAGGYVDDGSTTDVDSYGGQMTVNPSALGYSISGVSGCSTDNISAGSSDSFEEGVTDSIDIFSAATGAATACRWDYVGVADNITQKIPAGQAVGNYSISMTVSIQ